jgi:hypothetical protein
MNESALTEAVKTDLPSAKPNRLRRLALRIAALVLTVSGLGSAYWFTRPPELAWWKSPQIGRGGRYVSLEVPSGWSLNEPTEVTDESGTSSLDFKFAPRNPAPLFIRWAFREHAETAGLAMNVCYNPKRELTREEIMPPSCLYIQHSIVTGLTSQNGKIHVSVGYWRSIPSAFNRTYRQICNSLTIE